MINYENIITLEKSELKNITFDNTTYDAATVAHIIKIGKIAKALSDEYEKYKDIVKAHEEYFMSNKLVTISHKPSPRFDKDKYIAENGIDEYNKYIKDNGATTVTFG